MIHLSRQAIVHELEKAKDREGLIQPELVLKQQTPRNAPLHDYFEWDNDKAGHQWRLDQARRLIAVTITYETGERKTYSLSTDRQNGGGYRDAVEVLSSAQMRATAVQDALTEVKAWRNRHQHLDELAGLFRAIDKFQPKPALATAAD